MSTSNFLIRSGAVILLSVFAVAVPSRTFACILCVGFPEKTAVDFLGDARCVILARSATENPFSYACVETLKGGFDGAEIDLLVDSATRRKLAVDSRRTVLLIQDESGGDWRSLGVISDAYLRVLRRVVIVAENWRNEGGRQLRWQFFMPLFGHGDPAVRELAYLEMVRAPYTAIRKLGQVTPQDAYADVLTDSRYQEWRSLAILLLAQSDDPNDQQWIREAFSKSSRLGITSNLAALVTAAIEIDGGKAIDNLNKNLGSNEGQPPEVTEAFFAAISLHGAYADNLMRDQIVVSYRLLLDSNPSLAGRIAQDLNDWGRTELTAELSTILQTIKTLPPGARRTIANYLRHTGNKDLALGNH